MLEIRTQAQLDAFVNNGNGIATTDTLIRIYPCEDNVDYYTLACPIKISASNITIEGIGRTRIKSIMTGSVQLTHSMIVVASGVASSLANNLENIIIRNLNLIGNGATGGVSGIYVTNCGWDYIASTNTGSHSWFNSASNGITSKQIKYGVAIENCEISMQKTTGITFDGCSYCEITECSIHDNLSYGIHVVNTCMSIFITNNQVMSNTGVAIYVTTNPHNITIIGNHVCSNANTAIYVNGTPSHVIISENIISNNTHQAIASNSTIYGLICSENSATNNNNNGIYITGAIGTISANMVENNNGTGIVISGSFVAMIGNNCLANNGSGILISSTDTDALVGNICSNNANHGICLSGGCTGVMLFANMGYYNNMRGIYLQSASNNQCNVYSNLTEGNTIAGFTSDGGSGNVADNAKNSWI